MNSKSLRRLAADHSALHSEPLPPNYLFPPSADSTDNLTSLDVLLAGPAHTPFSAGVWPLHLAIPPTYPSQPPTAHFRTPIFHPNVDPQTGGVCVETLKREWDSKLTLRDVLVTISCLLIQPNPDSALNAEAGALIREGFEGFARRAKLLAGIHAKVPRALEEGVKEAQMRGQEAEPEPEEQEEKEEKEEEDDVDDSMAMVRPHAPVRRRRAMARLRSAGTTRRSDGSPSGAQAARRRHQPSVTTAAPVASRSFTVQAASRDSDPFSINIPADRASLPAADSDDASMSDADQENGATTAPASPSKSRAHASQATTPRRPLGAPVPLGELTLEDASVSPPPSPSPSDSSSDSEVDMEEEYPPSPRKSQSPLKRRPRLFPTAPAQQPPQLAGGSRAMPRGRIFTPSNATETPLAASSAFGFTSVLEDGAGVGRTGGGRQGTPSSRKGRLDFHAHKRTPSDLSVTQTTPPKRKGLFPPRLLAAGGVVKPKSPTLAEKRKAEKERKEGLERRLWRLCGGDVGRWNRGEFRDGCGGFAVKAARW